VLNKLSRLLDEAGISLTDHQKNQLVAYVGMLDKWNKAYNLTSVRDPNEMLVRHILDSIVVAPYLQGAFYRCWYGAGAAGDPAGDCSS
jgi:16S rRNA (guanine527-N7)-methyltransferase